MMTQELTEEQTRQLHEFVKKKYVDYYDIQIELVDHLASEIEHLQSRQPGLSFEKALDEVYRGFGIFGFGDLVDGKIVAAQRRLVKAQTRAFRGLFRLPEIAVTLLLLIFLVLARSQWSSNYFFILNALVSLPMAATGIYKLVRARSRKGYRLSAMGYSPFLGNALCMFNIYQCLYLGWVAREWFEGSVGHLVQPFIIWLAWLGWWASVRVLDSVWNEQKRLYPMAFT